jgi:hypothetical protein
MLSCRSSNLIEVRNNPKTRTKKTNLQTATFTDSFKSFAYLCDQVTCRKHYQCSQARYYSRRQGLALDLESGPWDTDKYLPQLWESRMPKFFRCQWELIHTHRGEDDMVGIVLDEAHFAAVEMEGEMSGLIMIQCWVAKQEYRKKSLPAKSSVIPKS